MFSKILDVLVLSSKYIISAFVLSMVIGFSSQILGDVVGDTCYWCSRKNCAVEVNGYGYKNCIEVFDPQTGQDCEQSNPCPQT